MKISKVLTVISRRKLHFIAFQEHVADMPELMCEARREEVISYLDFRANFVVNCSKKPPFLLHSISVVEIAMSCPLNLPQSQSASSGVSPLQKVLPETRLGTVGA